MKFIVKQEYLNKALGVVSKIATNRSDLTSLSTVLIKTSSNSITLTTTNLEAAITYTIPGKIEEEGSLAIPIRLLNDFVTNLPQENINVSSRDNNIHIELDHHSSTINGIDPQEFPAIPQITEGRTIKIKGNILKNAVQNTIIAASSDDSRPILNGLYVHNTNGKLTIAATDSYRLSEQIINQEIDGELSVVIPKTAASELTRFLEAEDNTELIFEKNQIQATTENVVLVAKTIDGAYPQYQQLIPQEAEVEATVNRQDFLNSVKVAGLFARENAGSIILSADEENNTISLSSTTTQVGENKSNIPAGVTGSGEVTLNSKYVIDALNTMNSEEVSIMFSEKVNPVVIRPISSDKDFLQLIMPLKT